MTASIRGSDEFVYHFVDPALVVERVLRTEEFDASQVCVVALQARHYGIGQVVLNREDDRRTMRSVPCSIGPRTGNREARCYVAGQHRLPNVRIAAENGQTRGRDAVAPNPAHLSRHHVGCTDTRAYLFGFVSPTQIICDNKEPCVPIGNRTVALG